MDGQTSAHTHIHTHRYITVCGLSCNIQHIHSTLSNGLLNFNHIWFPMRLIPVKSLLSLLFVWQRDDMLFYDFVVIKYTSIHQTSLQNRSVILDNDVIIPKSGIYLCSYKTATIMSRYINL